MEIAAIFKKFLDKYIYGKDQDQAPIDTLVSQMDFLDEHEKFLARSAIPQLPLQTKKTLNLMAVQQNVDEPLINLITYELMQLFHDPQMQSVNDKFWQHASMCASLARNLSTVVNDRRETKLNSSLVYLLGFTHNLGLLMFAKLFPPEFRLLEKWLRLNPKLSISMLEQKLLGMGQSLNIVRGGHTTLGYWLMRYWEMSDPYLILAKEHHNFSYAGIYAEYVKIIQISNQMLALIGIGDEKKTSVNQQLLDFFLISDTELQAQLNEILVSNVDNAIITS